MAYAPAIGMELIVQENYGLREFCRLMAEDLDHRCGKCYRLRLEQTARYAADHGFESFTSTLFVSPYQDHELLRQTAEQRRQSTHLLLSRIIWGAEVSSAYTGLSPSNIPSSSMP